MNSRYVQLSAQNLVHLKRNIKVGNQSILTLGPSSSCSLLLAHSIPLSRSFPHVTSLDQPMSLSNPIFDGSTPPTSS